MTQSTYSQAISYVWELFDRMIEEGNDYEKTYEYCQGWRAAIEWMLLKDEPTFEMLDTLVKQSLDLWHYMIDKREEIV